MSWSSSIHIRGVTQDEVAECLIDLNEHECFVGRSGPFWIGTFSKRCEISRGQDTPGLALKISQYFYDYTIGLCQYENEFKLWLFQKGSLIEEHPGSGAPSTGDPKILSLAETVEGQKKIDTALWRKRPQDPSVARGKSGQDLIVQAYQDMAEMPNMPQGARKQMAHKYTRALSSPTEKLKGLCKAIGIVQHDLNYSDLHDLPPGDKFALEIGLKRI